MIFDEYFKKNDDFSDLTTEYLLELLEKDRKIDYIAD